MNAIIKTYSVLSSFAELVRSRFDELINRSNDIRHLYKAIRSTGYHRALWLLNYFENILGGHESSTCKLPVDNCGRPLPWYTYPAIEYLQQFDFSNCDIFEYGSGNSSKFWSQQAKTIISVESDDNWYKFIRNDLRSNQQLFLITGKNEYVDAIHTGNLFFDIIIIDGIYRFNCAIEAVKRIKEGGLIILDNSDWWPKTAKELRDSGFNQVDFIGAGPLNSYAWCTSFFFQNVFSIPRQTNQKVIAVYGGLIQTADQDGLIK